MGKRKSIEPKKVLANKEIERDLYIVSEKNPPVVDDFLPDYNFKYDGIDTDNEAMEIIKSLHEFIKENETLVLEHYNSSSIEAVEEGFARGVAVAELFIKSMYIDKILND